MRKKSIVWSFSKEKLLELVQTSNSMRELVSKVGLNSVSGSNDETVKKCLEYHNIDWKPLALKGRISRNRGGIHRTVSDEELFTTNSKHGRTVVRHRILKDGLIPYKCAICGQEPEWNGKPMSLILDHINGIRDDHRLENLRFVCGNCNMQLDTTSGNNNTPRRKELRDQFQQHLKQHNRISTTKDICPVCGNEMTHGANMCIDCSKDKKREGSKCPSKDQLIQDILIMSKVQIGKKYGVSDKTIAKWLVRHNLPTSYYDIKTFRQQYHMG